MQEMIQEALPAIAVIGERARSVISRSSVGFALLAGVGAALIFGDLMRTIASAVLELARPEQAPRPYDFQQILAPAAGLVVARAAAGIPGALAYVAYSGVVLGLRWLVRILTCVGVFPSGPLEPGLGSFCQLGPWDVLGGSVPLLIGLTIGAVAARAIGGARRAGANPLLEAAGAHVIPAIILGLAAQAFVYQSFSVLRVQVAFILVVTLLSGAVAGAVAGLRSKTPLRTAALLVALLLLTWLYPLGVGQFQMAAGADRAEVYLFAVPLLDLITVPLAAWFVRERWNPRES